LLKRNLETKRSKLMIITVNFDSLLSSLIAKIKINENTFKVSLQLNIMASQLGNKLPISILSHKM